MQAEIKIKSPDGRGLVLREITKPRQDSRTWRVDEPEADRHFTAELTERDLHGTPSGWTPLEGEPTEEEILLAVGHAVDNAVTALGGKAQSTIRYEITVNSQEIYEARRMANHKAG